MDGPAAVVARVREIGDDLVDLQLLRRPIEVAERRADRCCEATVGRNDVAHEWKRTTRVTQRVVNEAGVDIEDAITKAGVGAGMAVVEFIRVQHEHLARRAVLCGAPIAEGLDAVEGHADGVGVMPMRAERMAGEEGLEPLEPRGARRRGPDPVRFGRAARSFKTFRCVLVHNWPWASAGRVSIPIDRNGDVSRSAIPPR